MDNQNKKITSYRDPKTNLQQGFMWFVRSIAKPADPFE